MFMEVDNSAAETHPDRPVRVESTEEVLFPVICKVTTLIEGGCA